MDQYAIEIITKAITLNHLRELAAVNYEHMIKGVVDLKKQCIALGGQLHADAETLLIEAGSRQSDLWGFNLLLNKPAPERIQYTSFINIRPKNNNRSLEVEDHKIRDLIANLVNKLIPADYD